MISKIKVSSFGAYLTSWIIEGREVLYQGSELKRGGIPLLFPNFDFGPPLPNHGFGRVTNWQLIEESPDCAKLRLTENDITPDYREIYPYKFIADLKLSSQNNELDYYLEVKNCGDVSMPLAPGLHPYWPVKHSQKNSIKINNYPEFNPSTADWEQSPPNDNYSFPGFLTICFPEYELVVREINEGVAKFKHLQIWSQNTEFPDYNFICLEPVTRPPNGINTDPILIKPGKIEKFHLSFEVTFR